MRQQDASPFTANEWLPLGSSSYYAVRFAPRQARLDLGRIMALYRLIRSVPVSCSDPAVALHKLGWWEEELERTEAGEARHPVTQALAPAWGGLMATAAFSPIVRATAAEIDGPGVADMGAWRAHCRDTGSALTRLLAKRLDADPGEMAFAETAGLYIRTVESVRDLGRSLRDGRCPLPLDRLTAAGLHPEGLLAAGDSDSLAGLLRTLTDEAHQLCSQALQLLAPEPHPALGTVFALSHLSGRIHQILAEEQFRVVAQRTSLTPIRKLFVAWRSHRQINRPRTHRLPRVI